MLSNSPFLQQLFECLLMGKYRHLIGWQKIPITNLLPTHNIWGMRKMYQDAWSSGRLGPRSISNFVRLTRVWSFWWKIVTLIRYSYQDITSHLAPGTCRKKKISHHTIEWTGATSLNRRQVCDRVINRPKDRLSFRVATHNKQLPAYAPIRFELIHHTWELTKTWN